MAEQKINNGAILGAIGFYNVFDDIHSKYFTGHNKVPFTNSSITGMVAYSIPYVVNGAFACELAMKSAIPEKQAKQIKHGLDAIYNSEYFDKKYKDAILNDFLLKGLSKDDFNTVLTESSKLFVEWRYFYEESDKGHSVPKNFYIFVDSCVKAMLSFSCFKINNEI